MPRALSHEDVTGFRDRLCREAERLFAENGPQAVSMRQLAAALGVSAMTPYHYFKDKDAILAAVRASAFDRFAASLEAARAGEEDPLNASLRVGDAYVDFALRERAAYSLMFSVVQPDKASYPDLERAEDRAARTMTAHVEALIDAGRLHGDPVMIGHVFWSALHGALMLQFAGKLGPEIDPEALRAAGRTALSRGFGLV